MQVRWRRLQTSHAEKGRLHEYRRGDGRRSRRRRRECCLPSALAPRQVIPRQAQASRPELDGMARILPT